MNSTMQFVWMQKSPNHSSTTSNSSVSTADVTNGHDVSSFLNSAFDDSREECAPSDLQSKYWIRVSRLESDVSDKNLKKLFYPHGADEAFTVWENDDLVGYVGFDAHEMAKLAVEKMDSFIPCKQTQSLRVSEVALTTVSAARSRGSCLSSTDTSPVALPTTLSFTPSFTISQPPSQLQPQHANMTYSAPQQQTAAFPTCSIPSVLKRHGPHALAALIESSSSVTTVAEGLTMEICCASHETLIDIAMALKTLSPAWPQRDDFLEVLLKQLLSILLDEDFMLISAAIAKVSDSGFCLQSGVRNCDSTQTKGHNAAVQKIFVNVGTTVGSLFSLQILMGDPFQLATQLLKHGVNTVAQVDGICAIAHNSGANMATLYPISHASYWALVGETATQIVNDAKISSMSKSTYTDSEIYASLLSHLRQMTAHTQLVNMGNNSAVACGGGVTTSSALQGVGMQPPVALPSTLATVSYPDASVDGMHGTTDLSDFAVPSCFQSQDIVHREGKDNMYGALSQVDMRRYTVYISHLPTALPQRTLKQLLVCAGPLNKVRICAGNGYNTLFAFAEMQTIQGAKACMRLNGINLLGCSIRVQTARKAIQDLTIDDAVYNNMGVVVQPCLFGETDAPISACISTSKM